MKRMKTKIGNLLAFIRGSNVAFVIFGEIIIGIFLSLFSFVLFLDIGKNVLENDTLHLDTSISNFIYQFREPFLTAIMIAISFLGDWKFLVPMSLAIIIYFVKKHLRHEAVLFLFALFIGSVVNYAVKILKKDHGLKFHPLWILIHTAFRLGTQ